MVELGRSGRNPEELSREFEPTAQAIRNWWRRRTEMKAGVPMA
jgi:transposase